MENERISDIVDALSAIGAQDWNEMPDLDLYMDQVVTYLKRQLDAFVSHPSGNLITPSVVNNYVKAEVVPRPVKKKYGRPQLSALTMSCLLKGVLSSQNIKALVMRGGEAPDETYHREFTAMMREVMGEEQQRLAALAQDGDRDELYRIALQFALRANADRYIADRLIELIENQSVGD